MEIKRLSTQRIPAQEVLRQLKICQEIAVANGPGKRYYIQTFGCQQNDNDSEKLAALLLEMGYQEADSRESADLILINTCSVRENAVDRFFGNLGILKPIKQRRPGLIIGACGCMMKQEEVVERIRKSHPFVDLVFAPSDLYRFPELLQRRLSGARRVYDITVEDTVVEGLPVLHDRKFRALCTIMYGCNNFCTYCIVPYTRGRERSREAEAILDELKQLAEQGYSEVMLLGQNVNSYGKDLSPRIDFARLLERVATETGIPRIRYMTSHPKDLSDDLIDVMARYENIERHIHLPLQCGSDALLKRMNRHYTVEQYMRIVELAKRRIPGIALSTDLIVGFPGETEADFQGTLDVVAAVEYDSAFTFQYSPRPGTPAAKWTDQIPPEVVSERFDRLIALQNENSLKANQRRVGVVGEVLIEGLSDHHGDFLTGRFSDNHLVNFSIPEAVWRNLPERPQDLHRAAHLLEGRFAQVRVTQAKTFSLQGEWEDWTA